MQAAKIDLVDDFGIKIKASYEFISRKGRGKTSASYTLQDQKNYF